MKKILKYSLLAVLALSALAGCKKALETDQFAGFSLAAIAPNPVMRGAELRIIGNGLENVSEVQFAGGVSVTEIEVVTKGERSEIRVTVPVEGPEIGPVTVLTKEGLKASTRFDLEFTEPIEQASFSPATALSGDVITIQGEYLQNVKCVIFGGDAKVNEFVSQSRHELKVSVPCNALTGPVILSDVDEVNDATTIPNQIYSATELTIGQPTVVKAQKAVYKSGDLVTVTGEHLDMIENLAVPQVNDVDFEIAADGTSITFNLPARATDGNITLTSYAGDNFDAGEIETVSVADMGITSQAEDGRYKAGCTVEITGEDLDLVTKVEFTNAEAAWYLSDGKIIATQPAGAKDGPVTVTLESGKQAATNAIEVVKPVVSGVDKTEAVAGKDQIVVSGEDLDLVTAITIGTKEQSFIACDFSYDAESGNITVPVPENAYTGVLTLKADSGYESTTAEIAVTYDLAVSITYNKASYALGKPIDISGKNLFQIEQIYIKDKKVTAYSQKTDDAMTFNLPDEIVSPGMYRLNLVLVDGTELTWPVPFEVTAPFTETFIWEGASATGDYAQNLELGGEDDWVNAGVAVGDVIHIYFTPDNAAEWQIQIFDGHWTSMSYVTPNGTQWNQENSPGAPAAGYVAFEVTEDVYAAITSHQWWGSALILQGKNVTITGLSFLHFGLSETVVWEGPSANTGDYAQNLELGGEDDWVNAELYEGAEVRIYFTPDDPSDWSIQIFDGHWNGMGYVTPDGTQWNAENSPEAIEKGYVSFIAEGNAFTALTTKAYWGTAIILQGKNLVVNKLSFL